MELKTNIHPHAAVYRKFGLMQCAFFSSWLYFKDLVHQAARNVNNLFYYCPACALNEKKCILYIHVAIVV